MDSSNHDYTNDDNPFGDSNLQDTFVWKKKYEKAGVKKIDTEQIKEINKQKVVKNREELEKVKQRRLEREREREERDREMAREQREREADQFTEWVKMEDVFHLKQAKLRSKLRIKEGRAKTVDILARYINVFGESSLPSQLLESEQPEETTKQKIQRHSHEDEEELLERIEFLQQRVIEEPYNNLNGLRRRDIEDLEEDIKIYLQLDSTSNINAEFWADLKVIAADELAKLKLVAQDSTERRRDGINPSVSADIAKILKGKTPQQLKTLQKQVEKKITSNEKGIDIEYWDTLLSRLKAQISRARLREFHEERIAQREELLTNFETLYKSIRPDFVPGSLKSVSTEQEASTSAASSSGTSKKNEDELKFLTSKELEIKCIQDYRAAGYSPKPVPIDQVHTDNVVILQRDRQRELEEQRAVTLRRLQTKPTPFVQFATTEEPKKKKFDKNKVYDRNSSSMNSSEQAFVKEAQKGMNDDEAVFSVEQVEQNRIQNYSWAEKYKPRKPRYFNRVHTGFEWNKYNQTHYDIDNPPPKVVQGYKFNIFYPDLIDKSATPQYKVTVCKEEPEFAYIRFTAGPPYEDVCFKIVNREWNYSYKAGFKSQFQNNILQLWFHFKRLRYRR